MSEEVENPKPFTRSPFQRRDLRPRLAPEKMRRQGLVTHLAFAMMGGKEQAIGFLNTFDPALGGRPLELATETEEGYSAVMAIMKRMAANGNEVSG